MRPEGEVSGREGGAGKACRWVLIHMYDPRVEGGLGGLEAPNHNWRSSVLLGGNKKWTLAAAWLLQVTAQAIAPISSGVYRLNARRE